MSPISLTWTLMTSIVSHFNIRMFYPSTCPTKFISVIGFVFLWRVKVQTKESVGRMHFGL